MNKAMNDRNLDSEIKTIYRPALLFAALALAVCAFALAPVPAVDGGDSLPPAAP